MLILSRKVGETFMIGDDIEITIVEVRGQNARVGIKAPLKVKVHRREIYDKIKKAEKEIR